MKKTIMVLVLGLIAMTSVSAYSIYQYKNLQTDYLEVREEALINELGIEENLLTFPDSVSRFQGNVIIDHGWSGQCSTTLVVQDGIIVGCGGR